MNDWCRISWESNPALKQNPVHKHIGFSLSPERQLMETRRRIEATSLALADTWCKHATTFILQDFSNVNPLLVVATNDPLVARQFRGFRLREPWAGLPQWSSLAKLFFLIWRQISKKTWRMLSQSKQIKRCDCVLEWAQPEWHLFHEKLWETWINMMQSIDTYWYWKSRCLTEPR